MEQKRYTDEEIIKGLQVCSSNGDCNECPINPHKGNYGFCTSLAIKAALDLISRQKAEIERLQKHNSVMAHKHYIDGIKEFTEELKKHKIKPEFPWDDYCIYESVIDDIAEKMIGGSENVTEIIVEGSRSEGEWIRYPHNSGIYCSQCKHKRRYRDIHDNFCPKCGAKMKGE